GFFPIDEATLDYLSLTGRDPQTVALVEAYAKAQGLWHTNGVEPSFTEVIELNLATVCSSLAGPKRPQDRIDLNQLNATFNQLLNDENRAAESKTAFTTTDGLSLHHGDVVIAAITSCTNTSNPSILMAAGLVAKKAVEKGLQRK